MHSFYSFKSLLLFGSQELQSNGISNYKKECEWLLLHIVKKNLTWLITHINSIPSEQEIKGFISCINKRKDHIPLQLILGKATFYGRDFFIYPDVFIPRQSSEVIIDILKKKNSAQLLTSEVVQDVYQLP